MVYDYDSDGQPDVANIRYLGPVTAGHIVEYSRIYINSWFSDRQSKVRYPEPEEYGQDSELESIPRNGIPAQTE